MKRLAILVAILATVAGSAVAHAAVPIPHTPCAAEAHGRHPANHQRYWLVNGWRLTELGWTSGDGQGCYL